MVGYNFSGGEKLAWELTPMLGGVIGETTGIAPGYKGSVSWRKLELFSEGEYLFDSGDTSDSFFYNWSELTLAPAEWFRFGMVTQRTRVYQSDRDIQRGLLGGRLVQERDPDRLCAQSGRRQAHVRACGRRDFLKSSRNKGSRVGAFALQSGGAPSFRRVLRSPARRGLFRGPQAPWGTDVKALWRKDIADGSGRAVSAGMPAAGLSVTTPTGRRGAHHGIS